MATENEDEMTTDNRTNEQVIKDELDDVFNDEIAYYEAPERIAAALRAANRLALPPGEDAVERAAKAYWLASEQEIHDNVTWEWDKEERKRYLWATRIVLQAAGTAPQAERVPDDAAVDKCIAEAEDLNQALLEIAEKYGAPLTGNRARWQDGVYLRELGDFLEDVNGAVARFAPVQPSITVDEAAINRAIGGVLFNVNNFPERAQSRLLGQDVGTLREKLLSAVVEAIRGEGK